MDKARRKKAVLLRLVGALLFALGLLILYWTRYSSIQRLEKDLRGYEDFLNLEILLLSMSGALATAGSLCFIFGSYLLRRDEP